MKTRSIRNFSIIAHIDHGKSTLADRLLELTGAIDPRKACDQVLDSLSLERERGITIKAKSVTLHYHHCDRDYVLNLIDTPGHVDFSYEVSKSLQACEGVLLLVDAAQGVEAQTVANAYLADEAGLTILPVLNKIDLAMARPDEVEAEIEHSLALEREAVLRVSAKTGQGVPAVLEAIVARIPPPGGDPAAPLRALVFDSVFNDYRGVVLHVRIVDGRLGPGERVRLMASGREYDVDEVGHFRPELRKARGLETGEVGYVIAAIRDLKDVRVGDTLTTARDAGRVAALPGYRPPLHTVFCGFYPDVATDYTALREALDRLALSDPSFSYLPESSDALGFGFRCGFLGLLHLEIVKERLERDHDLALVQTLPNVSYEIVPAAGAPYRIDAPGKMPDANLIREIREPVVLVSLIVGADQVGGIMRLCIERRGSFVSQEYISTTRVRLQFRMPLSEIIHDFYDRLKSITRGYGTMDYQFAGFAAADLVRLRILVARSEIDALSLVVHRSQAEYRGRKILQKLRKEIPRHLFEVALQAAVGGKIIARETISALSKDVTAKCYGGDVTRKRKLLEKQKEGKRRMRAVGGVEIPQKAFLAALRTDEEN
ncbi:MAG: elongation factor 4 [Planctomycetes bacterium]|nr:elongation factor 4 [Planctomycetota bacterium]